MLTLFKYIEPCTLNISLSDLCFSQYPDQYHSGGHCQYTAVIEHDQVLEGTTHHLRHWQNHWYVQWNLSLIRTPMGQKKVSLLVRCPRFRG